MIVAKIFVGIGAAMCLLAAVLTVLQHPLAEIAQGLSSMPFIAACAILMLED